MVKWLVFKMFRTQIVLTSDQTPLLALELIQLLQLKLSNKLRQFFLFQSYRLGKQIAAETLSDRPSRAEFKSTA